MEKALTCEATSGSPRFESHLLFHR